MFACAPPLAGVAAALLLAADTPALAGSHASGATTGPIHFACDPETDRLLCHFVRDALRAAYPERRIDMGETPDRGTTIRLVIETRSDERLAGHLGWNSPNSESGRGETLELMALDAPVSADLMRGFAQDLVRHSGLPL